jgi:hypothetical protein
MQEHGILEPLAERQRSRLSKIRHLNGERWAAKPVQVDSASNKVPVSFADRGSGRRCFLLGRVSREAEGVQKIPRHLCWW